MANKLMFTPISSTAPFLPRFSFEDFHNPLPSRASFHTSPSEFNREMGIPHPLTFSKTDRYQRALKSVYHDENRVLRHIDRENYQKDKNSPDVCSCIDPLEGKPSILVELGNSVHRGSTSLGEGCHSHHVDTRLTQEVRTNIHSVHLSSSNSQSFSNWYKLLIRAQHIDAYRQTGFNVDSVESSDNSSKISEDSAGSASTDVTMNNLRRNSSRFQRAMTLLRRARTSSGSNKTFRASSLQNRFMSRIRVYENLEEAST